MADLVTESSLPASFASIGRKGYESQLSTANVPLNFLGAALCVRGDSGYTPAVGDDIEVVDKDPDGGPEPLALVVRKSRGVAHGWIVSAPDSTGRAVALQAGVRTIQLAADSGDYIKLSVASGDTHATLTNVATPALGEFIVGRVITGGATASVCYMEYRHSPSTSPSTEHGGLTPAVVHELAFEPLASTADLDALIARAGLYQVPGTADNVPTGAEAGILQVYRWTEGTTVNVVQVYREYSVGYRTFVRRYTGSFSDWVEGAGAGDDEHTHDAVSTDDTITGDGTSDNPLAVTNPFTDADESKLDGIEAGAEVNVPPSNASTSARGIIEIATDAEVKTATDTVRAVPPAGVKLAVEEFGLSFVNEHFTLANQLVTESQPRYTSPIFPLSEHHLVIADLDAFEEGVQVKATVGLPPGSLAGNTSRYRVDILSSSNSNLSTNTSYRFRDFTATTTQEEKAFLFIVPATHTHFEISVRWQEGTQGVLFTDLAVTTYPIPVSKFTEDDESKLDGIEEGAQVNVKPDWNALPGTTNEILNKPTIPDAITAAEAKTLYESNPDTNAFTDDDESKLAGVALGATVGMTTAQATAFGTLQGQVESLEDDVGTIPTGTPSDSDVEASAADQPTVPIGYNIATSQIEVKSRQRFRDRRTAVAGANGNYRGFYYDSPGNQVWGSTSDRHFDYHLIAGSSGTASVRALVVNTTTGRLSLYFPLSNERHAISSDGTERIRIHYNGTSFVTSQLTSAYHVTLAATSLHSTQTTVLYGWLLPVTAASNAFYNYLVANANAEFSWEFDRSDNAGGILTHAVGASSANPVGMKVYALHGQTSRFQRRTFTDFGTVEREDTLAFGLGPVVQQSGQDFEVAVSSTHADVDAAFTSALNTTNGIYQLQGRFDFLPTLRLEGSAESTGAITMGLYKIIASAIDEFIFTEEIGTHNSHLHLSQTLDHITTGKMNGISLDLDGHYYILWGTGQGYESSDRINGELVLRKY